MTLAFLHIKFLSPLMRDKLVYFVFWMFITLSLRLGDVFGFVLTIAGLFVMMHIMDKLKDKNEGIHLQLP